MRKPMRRRNSDGLLLWIGFAVLGVALTGRAADEKPKSGEWPEGWLFRVPVTVAEAANSCDVSFEHGGLGQPDGRDVRVTGPHGEAISALVSFCDSTHMRVIFDGASGAGKYFVYFGNPSPKLPPSPVGIAAVQDAKEWQPKGGFTSVSYDPMGPTNAELLVSLEQFESYYERVIAQAEAAAQNPPADPKAPKHVIKGAYANAAQVLNTPDQYFHVFRAEIEITTAGKYDFLIANALSTDRFGVLFVDGERKTAVVQGWYVLGYGRTPFCVKFSGQSELKAGKHVIEMYTNRRNPEIRMGIAGGTSKVPDYLDGKFANYEALNVPAGELEAAGGNLTDAFHKSINEWLAQNRSSSARTVCQYLQKRFAGNAQMLKEFSAEYERVSAEAYEKNWLTEGKYPTRSGYVPESNFAPPLKVNPLPVDGRLDDRPHSSSCLSIEGALSYGLPFNVQDSPWGVTSAVAAEDNLLFAGTKNGVMHAVDRIKGTERWSFTSEGECVGAPLVYRGVLYYGTLDRRLYAIDIARGRMLWNFPAKGWVEGGPCAADGRVYFGSLDKNLYAIDAALGIERWEAPLDGPVAAPPVTDGKNVYVGTVAGTFYGVDATTGKIVWKYAGGASIKGGACLDKQHVFFGDAAGKVHCVDVANGQSPWKAPCAAGGPIGVAPILVGSVVYGGTTDGQVFGIDAESGERGWHQPLPANGEVARPPIFANGKLIFSGKMRGLVAGPAGTPAMVEYTPGLALQQIRHPVAEILPDGVLNEPTWSAALSFELLKPNGMTPAQKSEAKLFWDPKHFYVGLALANVAGIAPEDDSVTVVIDPRNDGLVAYQFTLTRSGTATTALLLAPGQDPADPKIKPALDGFKLAATGPAWAPQWTARAASTNDAGWTAELVIPFESLEKTVAAPPQHGGGWRINIIRNAGKSGSSQPLMLVPMKNPNGIGTPAEWQPLQFIAENVKP
jgi:outer membrane protein assembly factor BamB